MKILIASDIHGSSYYTTRISEIFENGNFDRLVLLGDILYHGARNDLPEGYNPKIVFQTLNKYKDRIIAIKGNCDSEVDEMVLDFPLLPRISMEIDGVIWNMLHGHHMTDFEKGTIVLSGHTHVKRDEVIDGVRYLNPGSTTIPKDGSNSYLVYDGKFTFYDFSGNILDI